MAEAINVLVGDAFAEVQQICEIVQLVNELSSSSDESSCEERICHPKCIDFVRTIDEMDDVVFKSHLRIKRRTANYLIDRFLQSSFHLSDSNAGRAKISCKTSIYMYVWYISNTVTYRQLGNLFGTTKSSAWKIVRRISAWLITLSHEFIQWPQQESVRNIARKFYLKSQIPNVIGAIDCTHIGIKVPVDGKQSYFDRKKNCNLVLQAVVDADKKFLDIYVGEPGSLHDSRVLRRSSFYAKAEEQYTEMFPNSAFILGDSAYFCTKWLVPPFKDNGHLTNANKKFNKIHSQARVVVENSFGLLKNRFRRLLKFTEQTDLNALTNLIGSICVMHNICIIKDDLFEEEEPLEVTEDSFMCFSYSVGDENLRDQLFNHLRQANVI